MKNKTLRSSVTAFGAALLVTLIILLLIGKNPIEFLNIIFTSLFKDTSGNLLKGFLQKSLPILFAGLGVAFAFRVGLFNIGADGQLTMGMLGAFSNWDYTKYSPSTSYPDDYNRRSYFRSFMGVHTWYAKSLYGGS